MNSAHHSNGDVVISTTKPGGSECRHGFTVHSVQGRRMKNIFIDRRKLFDPIMGYNVISRERTFDHVKIVIFLKEEVVTEYVYIRYIKYYL